MLDHQGRALCHRAGQAAVSRLRGAGPGRGRFTAHRRIIGELNWLMLRYPLRIREGDRPRWEQALEEAGPMP